MKKVVALITGGNRGIGASCVEALAKMGASVVINYCHHEEEALALEKQIKSEYDVDALVIKADVSVEEEVEEMVNTVVDTFGGIDILVNNAGFGDCGDFSKTDLNKELNMIKTNITAYHILRILPS